MFSLPFSNQVHNPIVNVNRIIHSSKSPSTPSNVKVVVDSTDPEFRGLKGIDYLYAFQVGVVYWRKNTAQSRLLNIKYFAAKADTGT